MKTKKKSWLAILLAVIMVSATLPTTVLAASWPPQLYVNGVDILSAEGNTVACGNGTALYDSENNILTLKNATITNEYDNNYGIYARDMNLNIVLVGTNSVSATNQGIYAANSSGGSAVDDGYLNISGSGSIKITAGINSIYGYKGVTISGGNITCEGLNAIGSEGAVKIENASVTGTCTVDDGESYGVLATQDIAITGGTVQMQGYWCGIQSILSSLSINGGSKVTVKEAIGNAVNTTSLTVEGAKLTADNTGDGAAVYSVGDITFKNGNAEISSVSSNGLYADGAVIIEEESEITASGYWRGIYGWMGWRFYCGQQCYGGIPWQCSCSLVIRCHDRKQYRRRDSSERLEWYKRRRSFFGYRFVGQHVGRGRLRKSYHEQCPDQRERGKRHWRSYAARRCDRSGRHHGGVYRRFQFDRSGRYHAHK